MEKEITFTEKLYIDREEQTLKQKLTIFWWNFRRKTKKFSGTIAEYIQEEGITYKRVQHENGVFGYRFESNIGSSEMVYTEWTNFEDALRSVIQYRLVYMGDRAEFEFNYITRTVNNFK